MMQRNKKRKNRRENWLRQQSKTTLLQRTQSFYPGMKTIVRTAQDGIKMSNVLEQFVEPYMVAVQTTEMYRTLLQTALVAWNVALFPKAEQAVKLEKFLSLLPDNFQITGKAIILEMIERKQTLFSQYKRSIFDFELTDTGTSWHLSVVSTPFKS